MNKKFRLSFEDEETENRFQKDYFIDTLAQNKFAIQATLIIYIFYLPFSYFITPNDFYADLILMILLPILSSIIFLFRIKRDCFKRNIPLNLLVYSILVSIPPIISLSYTKEYHQVYLNNYILLIVGVLIMFGAPFIVTFSSILTVNIFAAIILLTSGLELSFICYNLFFVNTALAISGISAYFIEKSKREIYLAKYNQEALTLQIKKQEKLIVHQAKLAQMGEMTSMIAHQWRQPLSSISSTIIGIKIKRQTGRYNFDNKKDREDFLVFLDEKHDNISEYIEFLSKTIDEFRTFFKKDKDKEYISINTLIKRALKIIEPSIINKNIKIIKDFNTDNKIYIYQNEFMQVILNILKNSEDNFLEKNTKDATINISTKKENNSYIIEIFDNGGGIPDHIINHVFDAYFSTKDKKNGTGIGLYMSRTIINEHHKGELTVKNIENGVLFKIKLNGDNNV